MSRKPEPIRVSAQGIEAKPITMNEPETTVDWRRLINLPPFQMFAIERAGQPVADVMAWLPGWVAGQSEKALLDEYCRWHTAKGLWPDESPFGEA